MIVYREANDACKAIYFDNEGHTIHYAGGVSGDSSTVVFLSDVEKEKPRFRLSYRKTDDGSLEITFDMAAPDKPDAFARYLTGTATRKQLLK
jgi:hypothetical protein